MKEKLEGKEYNIYQTSEKIYKSPFIKPKKLKRNWLLFLLFLLIFLSIIIVFFIACIIIYLFYKKNEKPKGEYIYKDENLVSTIDYRVNQTFNILSKSVLNSIIEMNNMNNLPYSNRTLNRTEYIHYTLGIEDVCDEFDIKAKTKKKYFKGYVSLNNITIENDTDIIYNLYLDNIKKAKRFLKRVNKLRYLTEKNINVIINDDKDIVQPIISLDFYKNGKIKQIYIPKNLESQLFNNLYNLIENFIPKLSKDLFCDNITEEINKIDGGKEDTINLKKNDSQNISENDEIQKYFERRRLERKNKRIIRYKIISNEK